MCAKQEFTSAKSSGNHDRMMYTYQCPSCKKTWQTEDPKDSICDGCLVEAEEVC